MSKGDSDINIRVKPEYFEKAKEGLWAIITMLIVLMFGRHFTF